MPVKHNTSDISGVYVGTSLVPRMYCGTTLVYQSADLVDQNVAASGGTAAGATARVGLTSTGDQRSKVGAASYIIDNVWKNGGVASLYSVRATLASSTGTGSMGGSALSTWLNLAVDVEWTAAANVGSIYVATLTLELRLDSTGAILDTKTAVLESERF